MLDRRELLHRASLLLGGAITASAAAGILGGCVATPEPVGDTMGMTSGGFFTPAEMADVTALADQIIPRTDTPGALDVGVPAFADKMLAGYYTDKERDLMRAGLKTVSADAMRMHGKTFASLTAEEKVAMMKGCDKTAYASADPHFFRLVKELTVVGFCSSEAGATKLMRYEQTPGPYRGDVPMAEIGKAWALG